VVSSAEAAERWPAETCAHLQEIRDSVAALPKEKATEYQKALMLIPIRVNLHTMCGANNQAEIDAGHAVIKAGDPYYKKLIARIVASQHITDDPGIDAQETAPVARERAPLSCVTVGLGGDMSATNCN